MSVVLILIAGQHVLLQGATRQVMLMCATWLVPADR